MGSGMEFVRNGYFPVYVATKSATHALAVALRQDMNSAKDENVKRNLMVVEVVAPYVATDFEREFRSEALPKPPPLGEIMDAAMDQLGAVGAEGMALKEVAMGVRRDVLICGGVVLENI